MPSGNTNVWDTSACTPSSRLSGTANVCPYEYLSATVSPVQLYLGVTASAITGSTAAMVQNSNSDASTITIVLAFVVINFIYPPNKLLHLVVAEVACGVNLRCEHLPCRRYQPFTPPTVRLPINFLLANIKITITGTSTTVAADIIIGT